jgi:hypothetical protein
MWKIANDTRVGCNTFLRDQRKENADATVSLYEFDPRSDGSTGLSLLRRQRR